MTRFKFVSKPNKAIKFIKGYSTQLGFTLFVLCFLTVTVGEGQAYEAPTTKISQQVVSIDEGFIGKPQLFIGQTLLTGEVQQMVAINYTVETGDTLTSIASRYNLSVGTIIQANNIPVADIERIKPGTSLLIPAEDTDTSMAWLDNLNRLKESERQEQLRRQQEQARRLAVNRPTVRLAQSIGEHRIIGVFRNLPTRGAVAGQCTNWVKYKRPDLPTVMGNGGQYLAFARMHGIRTGTVPRVGAVVVTTESWVGHVAYVEAVYGDTIRITEMNFVGPFIVSERVISIHSNVIKGYVY